jgi:hypothetical protein
MKLHLPMILATVIFAGLGLGFAQKYMMAGPDVGVADPEFWQAMLGRNDDSGIPTTNDELIILGRMSLKDALVRKLVEREMTLQQVAARFVYINKDNKPYMVGLSCYYPQVDLKEAVYQDVLKWTDGLYEKDPDYPVIRARLQRELEECRKENFPLPPIPLQVQAAAD